MNEAKQKAKELVEKFENILPEIEIYNYDESIRQPQRIAPYNKKDTNKAKQCALIACDEQLELIENMVQVDWRIRKVIKEEIQSVKQEITNL